MRLRPDHILKFDQVLPIYNWFYPLNNTKINSNDWDSTLTSLPISDVNLRALYIHIPFCRSICTFCPFTRSLKQNDSTVNKYVDALIKEIEMKSQYSTITAIPIEAIFFGGGSPSILSSRNFRRINIALRNSFDLSNLREFSVEMSLPDLSLEKIHAMKEIGVTHARFGIQTFNKEYRRHFKLTSPLNAINEQVPLLKKNFPIVSFDMMYGMDGQTENEFIDDLEKAVKVGVNNIAFYPINNLVTQLHLHQNLKEVGRKPLSGQTRFYMNVLLREFMKNAGFLPHNGHEYVAVDDTEIQASPVTTRTYSFLYHKNLYACSDREILGFGVDAMSVTRGHFFQNTASLQKYINDVSEGRLPISFFGNHDKRTVESRGIILHLPYHGYIENDHVDWGAVHPETLCALNDTIKAGLVQTTSNGYKLTQEGWYWYVNMMYYLSPHKEQVMIDRFITKRNLDQNRLLDIGHINF